MLIKTATIKNAIVDRILDPNKVAALNLFPNFNKRTAAVEPIKLYPDQFLYLRNRSISALETHGANQNGDAFPRAELRKAHKSFIGSPVTVDHTEQRVIGMVLDSVWVPKQIYKAGSTKEIVAFHPDNLKPGDQIIGDWVENILAINKKQADLEHPNLVEQTLDGEITDTSMGTMVDYSVCSVPGCRKQAAFPNEYCKHISSYKGKKYSGADTHEVEHNVYEENYGLTFFEDSVIIPDKLGGTAGGEGADTGAKMLEQLASKEQKGILDLTPYMVFRKAAIEEKTATPTGPVSYGEEVVEVGQEPEAVEDGKNQHEKIKERNNDQLKSKQLKLQVQQIVDDLEDSLDHLKMFTDDSMVESPEDSLIQGNKKIRISGDVDAFARAATILDRNNIKYTAADGNFNKKTEKIASVVEFTDTDSYKFSDLMRDFKNVNISIIESGVHNMKKGQKVVLKASVKAVTDDGYTVSIDKAQLPVTEDLIASLKDIEADAKISLAAKKIITVADVFVEADEEDEEIQVGDSVELPGEVVEEADDEGIVTINLDVNAETEFEEQTIPVVEVAVPEDAVEVEEVEEGEEAEDAGEATGDTPMEMDEFAGKNAGKKTDAATPGKEPAPKAKVSDAGGNSPSNKVNNEENSALQKAHTPAPKDKVPDAGKNASKKAEANDVTTVDDADTVVEVNEDTISAAIKDATAGQKKKAEYPEEVSTEEGVAEIPKNTDGVPEQAAEKDYLGGEHDQSKIPDGNVTQLSSKRIAELEGVEQQNQELVKQNETLTTENTELQARLKPLEVASLVNKLVSKGALQNNKVVIANALKEYGSLYDEKPLEFQASLRIAGKLNGMQSRATLKEKTAVNEFDKATDQPVVDRDVPKLDTEDNEVEYAGLDTGEFFSDSLTPDYK